MRPPYSGGLRRPIPDVAFLDQVEELQAAIGFLGYQAALAEKWGCGYFERSKAGIQTVFNVTAMERSILAELFERGGRGQLSGLRDRRPIERLVNKGFVERHTLNSQQEEYVLTAIGKKVLDNK
jgi:hypothetical protein